MAPEARSNYASHGLTDIVKSLKKFVEDRWFKKVDEKIEVMNGRVKTVEDMG